MGKLPSVFDQFPDGEPLDMAKLEAAMEDDVNRRVIRALDRAIADDEDDDVDEATDSDADEDSSSLFGLVKKIKIAMQANDDANGRQEAAHALGEIADGLNSAMSAIHATATSDASEEVRQEAKNVLAKIQLLIDTKTTMDANTATDDDGK